MLKVAFTRNVKIIRASLLQLKKFEHSESFPEWKTSLNGLHESKLGLVNNDLIYIYYFTFWKMSCQKCSLVNCICGCSPVPFYFSLIKTKMNLTLEHFFSTS